MAPAPYSPSFRISKFTKCILKIFTILIVAFFLQYYGVLLENGNKTRITLNYNGMNSGNETERDTLKSDLQEQIYRKTVPFEKNSPMNNESGKQVRSFVNDTKYSVTNTDPDKTDQKENSQNLPKDIQKVNKLKDIAAKSTGNKHLTKQASKKELSKTANEVPSKIKPTQINYNYSTKTVGTLHNFRYIINNRSICDKVNLTYLIYVHSHPAHFKHRLIMRQTWGQNSVIPRYESRIIFMLGNPTDDNIQAKIYEECNKYGDIIQEDYVDSYKNLTHKAVGAMKWIATNCAKVKFVFKSDDDVYTDIFRLLNLLQDKYRNSTRFLMGHLWKDNEMHVLRGDPRNCMKWCVKESEFKGTYYPKYHSGSFIVLSGDIVRELYESSKTTPFFWVDDVYFTGLLPKKLPDVTYYSINNLHRYDDKAFERIQYDTKNPKKFIVTLTGKTPLFWYKTLQNLSLGEKRRLLGDKQYSKLILQAEKLLSKKL